MGGKGHVERKVLLKVETEYKWLSDNGEAQDINLEKRTGANQQFMLGRISQMTTGIDYHLGHRNCEHFANYVTGQTINSEQSVFHLTLNPAMTRLH